MTNKGRQFFSSKNGGYTARCRQRWGSHTLFSEQCPAYTKSGPDDGPVNSPILTNFLPFQPISFRRFICLSCSLYCAEYFFCPLSTHSLSTAVTLPSFRQLICLLELHFQALVYRPARVSHQFQLYNICLWKPLNVSEKGKKYPNAWCDHWGRIWSRYRGSQVTNPAVAASQGCQEGL